MNLYEVVKDLYNTERALESMNSKYENPIDTAMRISRISTLHDIIDRLMMTDEYLESSKSGNDLKESRYETLTYIAK